MNELPTVYWVKYPIASKEHKCVECRNSIVVGEEYAYISGIWDKEYEHYKQCKPCHDLFNALTRKYYDQGPPLGEMWSWCGEFHPWEIAEVTQEDVDRLKLDWGKEDD